MTAAVDVDDSTPNRPTLALRRAVVAVQEFDGDLEDALTALAAAQKTLAGLRGRTTDLVLSSERAADDADRLDDALSTIAAIRRDLAFTLSQYDL